MFLSPFLVIFSCKYVKDKDVAEDLVQDLFFHLWLNHKKLDIKQSLKSYFYSAVKNRSLDYLKRKRVGEKIENEMKYLRSDLLDEPTLFVQSELEEYIRKALDKLPQKCKKVFLMNRFEGIKPAEIAKMENISVRTVEGHIGKAIKILRTELKPYLPTFLIMIITRL